MKEVLKKKTSLFKRIIASVLTMAMLFSMSGMSGVVFAEDVEGGLGVPNADVYADTEIEPFQIVPIPDPLINPQLSDSPISTSVSAKPPKSLSDAPDFVFGRATTQMFEGTILNEGGISYLNAELQAGESLYVTLECPLNENLNYDLFAYEYDLISGDIMSTPSDASVTETYFNTYADGSRKTCDEGVMVTNTTSDVKIFAVIVSATRGGSASDLFYLTISKTDFVGVNASTESNESIFSANEAPYGDISIASDIEAVNDQDWYLLSIPNTLDYRNMNIFAYDAQAEVYEYNNDGNLVLQNKTSRGYYQVEEGQLLAIRVTGGIGEYYFKAYPVDMIPYRATVEYQSTNPIGLSHKRTYNHGTLYTFWGTDLKSRVRLTTVSGYLFSGVASIDVKWRNGGNGDNSAVTVHLVEDGTGWTNQAPFSRVTSAIGRESFLYTTSPRSLHYYDYDDITVSVRTHGGDLTHTEHIYHFAYSETSI